MALAISAIIIVSTIIVVIVLLNFQNKNTGSYHNLWVWVSGNKTRNQLGVYGQKGVNDSNNIPGARTCGTYCSDSDGNLWLFGGLGYDNTTAGLLNDLWKFDGENWTWISGNYSVDNLGSYGIKGVPDAENVPGARRDAISWIDDNDVFWLFGGMGLDNQSTSQNALNDLWRFDGVNWTWISGNFSRGEEGIYGEMGVPNLLNVPGARCQSVCWLGPPQSHSSLDPWNELWLFGGQGYTNSTTGILNDLWRFKDGTWTWISGNFTTFEPGVYGQKEISDNSNTPGARLYSNSFSDYWGDFGYFFLFGGKGMDSQGDYGYLNDLWRFDGVNWTWISGSDLRNQSGFYGVKGVINSTNVPCARMGSANWIDKNGRLWIFGGESCDSNGNDVYLNDLWMYDRTNWVWISGNSSINNPGSYGSKNIYDSGNMPGARYLCHAWLDGNVWSPTHNNLFLFGGTGLDSENNYGYLNDLWRYII